MTYEEAIIDIRENIQPIVGGKSLDIAISAIEKQIPKKVKIVELKRRRQNQTRLTNGLNIFRERQNIARLNFIILIKSVKRRNLNEKRRNYKSK